MKTIKTNQAGFTLIELLVTISIIGVLSAVGIPIYQGYQANAKVASTKENHNRIKSFIASELTKCSAGTTSNLNLKDTLGAKASVDCSSNAANFATAFINHFVGDGWKNPYDSSKAAVVAGVSFIKGQTAIAASGNDIDLKTQSDGTTTSQISSSILVE
jgi:type IV pilus assembly protein PilA